MPDWSVNLRARLDGLTLGPAREDEIIEELSQHLDERYEELRTTGTSDAEARRQALEELGDGDALGQRLRGLAQAHIPPPVTPGEPDRGLLHGVWQDLRYGVRMISRMLPRSAWAAPLSAGSFPHGSCRGPTWPPLSIRPAAPTPAAAAGGAGRARSSSRRWPWP